MLHRIVIVTLLTFATFATSSANPGADRLNGYLQGLTSLHASFKQTLYDEDLNRLEDSEGLVTLQRPGRFRWDYETPYPQSIVSNGATLWMYDSELEQVTVKQLQGEIENTPSLLLTSEEPLEDHFDISELAGVDGKIWVELKPKSSEATFASMRVGFAEDELSSMELVDNFGQITQLRFSDVRRNEAVDDAQFDFTPPEGVDVLGDIESSESSQ